MVSYELVPSRTALIIFDMMNDFLLPGAPLENVEVRDVLIPKLKKLIELSREKGVLIVYTQHAHRKDGSDMGLAETFWKSIKERRALIKDTNGVNIYHEIAPKQGDIVIEKRRYSAFFGTDLEMILKNRNIDTIIICGASTNIGCETTARDAANRDYKVIYPSDGSLTRDLVGIDGETIPRDLIQKVVVSTLAHAFAQVMTLQQLEKELERK
ncbi:MAG: isochorismatase family cysteine hydrolase [Dehalococcoidia bacterium]|nr:isochorismatase family cysteine hydrolase [Dehalococcoidia bacterium]